MRRSYILLRGTSQTLASSAPLSPFLDLDESSNGSSLLLDWWYDCSYLRG